MLVAEIIDNTCVPRIARAGVLVDRGEWASGHAIASGLLSCANRTRCPRRGMCAFAAQSILCDIRRLLAN